MHGKIQFKIKMQFVWISLLISFPFLSVLFRLSQCEDDKVTKESQIRSLKEELRGQEDMVAKLIKEKRTWADDRYFKCYILRTLQKLSDNIFINF